MATQPNSQNLSASCHESQQHSWKIFTWENMYRFFVPVENVFEEEIRITGDDINHIKNVLRMTVGEKVVVSCGQGTDYYCIIEDIQETGITLRIEDMKAAVTEALDGASGEDRVISGASQVGQDGTGDPESH